jgi:cell division protein FtsB
MDNDSTKSDIQEQGPKKGIVIIVIAILLGTNGLLLWQFFEKKSNLDDAQQKIVTTTAEKEAVQAQLNQIKTEYEKVKSENSNLQTELSSRDEEIKAKVAEIQRLIAIGGPAQIAKAKAEMAQLREMNNMYMANIDSLNKVNSLLQAENQNLSSTLNDEKGKVQNLNDQNSKLAGKIAAGSILKAMNIKTEGQRVNKSNKVSVTNKAKQVTQIQTSFLLPENRVIDAGPVDLYFRMLGPDGSVMSTDQATFDSNGQSLVYSMKKTVDYANADLPVQEQWSTGTPLVKGKYTIEIYHMGNMIGKSTLDLK